VCIPIVDVNEDKVSGRIECGSVHAGEKLLVLPSKGIVKFSKTNAGPGAYLEGAPMSVVEGGDLGALIHPGSVLVDANFGLKKIIAVNSFYARILVLNDDFMPIVKGQSVTINCHTAMTEAIIARIVSKEGAAAGKPVKCLVKNDRAVVEISLRKGCLIVIEPDCVSRVTGRVVIRDRGVTIAAGRVVTL
jgi:translation elongation factor EF-1alpha